MVDNTWRHYHDRAVMALGSGTQEQREKKLREFAVQTAFTTGSQVLAATNAEKIEYDMHWNLKHDRVNAHGLGKLVAGEGVGRRIKIRDRYLTVSHIKPVEDADAFVLYFVGWYPNLVLADFSAKVVERYSVFEALPIPTELQ